ncbi:S8 family serine peptidase [Roseateles sp. DAIF2]|uniref:S8 family serine peptidase n=1 Tax=Roseateles sp. DAIF2 TaxID=2714952 RepID=UPI0018A2F2BC|nr:S8 family serine peptidase [Roseateles sp. DAIF2]QPF71860.1 S8 family serine peptidase [Roseateles sp. DAIF2]
MTSSQNSRNKIKLLSLAIASALMTLPAQAQTQAPQQRQTITRADELPRRVYTLPKLPSDYLALPLAELKPLGAQLEADLRADLAAYDIKDAATLREIYASLATLAQLRGDWAAVPGLTAQARALQDKAGPRQTAGVLTDLIAQQQLEKRDAAWLQGAVRQRYGAMNWAEVQDQVKSTKGQIEVYNPELVLGVFKAQLDVLARNGQGVVPAQVLQGVIGARLQKETLPPNQAAVVAGLQAVLDAQAKSQEKPDIWTPRTVALQLSAAAKPVVVGIWDSGVDLKLFPGVPERGLAFDENGKASPDLLRPLGAAEPRWPQLKTLVKGAMDQRAALDTEASRQFRSTLAGLKADQAKGFTEDMALVGLYTHGTHVAGIALDGNPFAKAYAATMLWSHKTEPILPTEERSKAAAAVYGSIVEGFKKAGVRVVNMSWRYGPSFHEGALAYHNVGKNPEERKQLALKLFKTERDALNAAIAGAPEILFVAGAGNEDNSADFQEYIPAGLSLPNLITVGAVDKSGSETSFSTFGKTVVVHANGFEVDSFIPGGERMKLSGTSMASPQVANLAAKLIALKPELTPQQTKALILEGAERQPGADGKPGRVNLVNPRKSLALAGLKDGA